MTTASQSWDWRYLRVSPINVIFSMVSLFERPCSDRDLRDSQQHSVYIICKLSPSVNPVFYSILYRKSDHNNLTASVCQHLSVFEVRDNIQVFPDRQRQWRWRHKTFQLFSSINRRATKTSTLRHTLPISHCHVHDCKNLKKRWCFFYDCI